MHSSLAGRRIVVTREADQAEAFCDLLSRLGAEPVPFPTIDFAPVANPAFDPALARLHQYRWLVFTSANAVCFFFQHAPWAASSPSLPQVAAIGPATAQHLRSLGVEPDFVPAEYTGACLAQTLPDAAGARILLPRGRQGLPETAEGLRRRGATVDDIAIYDTVAAQPSPSAYAGLYRGVDVVTFTSPSTARSFFSLVDKARLEPALIACIGPTTADAVTALGYRVDLVADLHTVQGMVDALQGYYAGAPHPAGAPHAERYTEEP